MRPATFLDLTERYHLPLRYLPGSEIQAVQPPRELARVFEFSDFREFLFLFAAVSRSLVAPQDYARLASEFVRDAREQNVAYGEIFVSPSVWRFFHPELDVRECFAAMHHEFTRATDMTLRLIVDLTRNFGLESAMETAKLACDLTDYGVVAVGLGGDEARFPAKLFGDPFAYARASGLHTVAHAGEADGPQSVRSAILDLGAERIGHGVRALEDDTVLALLREKNIPCEVCPTSNYRTGVVGAQQEHPLGAMLAAGLPVVIDADDPTLFATSISHEYALVAETFGLDVLNACIERAITTSFADSREKARLAGLLVRANAATNPLNKAL